MDNSLQYITLTRPELAFSINKLSQFLSCSTITHWQACKRVIRYLQSIVYYCLQFSSGGNYNIQAYANIDWACDIDDRKSVGAYAIYFGDNLVSWSFKI